MLDLQSVQAGYGPVTVLKDISFSVAPGEVLCLFGRNGAGKTTVLKSIMGLVPTTGGEITFAGDVISSLPAHEVPKRGIGYVPQGRRLFAEMSVRDNLEIGLMARNSDRSILDDIFALFPILASRLDQVAGTLSGGEQQMLATARALCIDPSLILMDEPTEGLQPSMIDKIRDVILELRARGKAVLLVEQRVEAVLSVADRICFIENGHVRAEVSADELRADPAMVRSYVGV
jgi:branched-chain amino acid transport system ATP-binding protein